MSSSLITLIALAAILAYSFYAVLLAGQLSLAQLGIASLAAFTSTLVVPDEPLFGFDPAAGRRRSCSASWSG